MGWYLSPSSNTAIWWELTLPRNSLFQLSRTLSGFFNTPGCSNIPLGEASLAKNFAPYSSVAIPSPTAFFAMAMGEYPTIPSYPRPGICST